MAEAQNELTDQVLCEVLGALARAQDEQDPLEVALRDSSHTVGVSPDAVLGQLVARGLFKTGRQRVDYLNNPSDWVITLEGVTPEGRKFLKTCPEQEPPGDQP